MNISPILTIAGWALLIGLGLYIFSVVSLRSQRREMKISIVLVILLLIGGLGLNILGSGLVFIDQFEAGVVVSPLSEGGVRPEPLGPGIHFVIPFIESVDRFSVAKQEYTMSGSVNEGAQKGNDSVEARTSDGQVVLVDASVIFSVDPNQVVNVHIRWQDRYVDGVIRAISRGVIRDTVSQYGIEQVYSTHRVEMTDTIKRELTRRFADNGLFLVDFVLRNIAFSQEYSASVEQKQIAEQLAQQAAFTVEQRRQEAEQARQVAQGLADAVVIKAQGDAEARLIEAEAEAQAIELLAAALALNPDVLTLEYIQKLAPNIQVMLVPTENPFLLPLPSLGGGATTTP